MWTSLKSFYHLLIIFSSSCWHIKVLQHIYPTDNSWLLITNINLGHSQYKRPCGYYIKCRKFNGWSYQPPGVCKKLKMLSADFIVVYSFIIYDASLHNMNPCPSSGFGL